VHAVVVATKVDKLSRAERVRHLREFDDVFHAPVVAVSAARHEGIEELWQQIIRHLPQ
jgi:GTP-binding protein EngB required for normal cell division